MAARHRPCWPAAACVPCRGGHVSQLSPHHPPAPRREALVNRLAGWTPGAQTPAYEYIFRAGSPDGHGELSGAATVALLQRSQLPKAMLREVRGHRSRNPADVATYANFPRARLRCWPPGGQTRHWQPGAPFESSALSISDGGHSPWLLHALAAPTGSNTRRSGPSQTAGAPRACRCAARTFSLRCASLLSRKLACRRRGNRFSPRWTGSSPCHAWPGSTLRPLRPPLRLPLRLPRRPGPYRRTCCRSISSSIRTRNLQLRST